MHPVRLILILLTCSLAGLTADAQNGSHQILGRSRASIPRPGVVKTEPTALAAGAERTVDLRTPLEAPEASAFGSQEMTFSLGLLQGGWGRKLSLTSFEPPSEITLNCNVVPNRVSATERIVVSRKRLVSFRFFGLSVVEV